MTAAPDDTTSAQGTTEEQGSEHVAFPIVGIGASAGGLTATSEVLRHLGDAPGIAVVVLHHLDPKHESHLVAVLSHVTSLPVSWAVDGEQVSLNRVYVKPADSDIAIENGALRLTTRTSAWDDHLPIDRFLESLAVDQKQHAVAVILSGGGSDGSNGIAVIKAEGGVVCAQDQSAETPNMPENAIATGCVDFVLSPPRIGQLLCRLGHHLAPGDPATDDSAQLRAVLVELRKATGLDFSNYKTTTVRRRVQRRLLVHDMGGMDEYARWLAQDPAEAAILGEEMLIHVTSFFRDPEMFEVLKLRVLPKLLETRPNGAAIRIWVAGCSTGEEVYSIAITLLEVLDNAGANNIPIKVFGTDVSQRAIGTARVGQYPKSIERDVSAERLERFFVCVGGAYQVRREVRDLCVFAKQDATRDPPFSSMDLISCRNLMIYLGPTLQDRVLPIFHYALKEPGFLILGTAETTRAFPGFAEFDGRNRIYTRTSAAPRMLFDFSGAHTDVPSLIESQASDAGPRDVHREADRLVLAGFGPPGVVVTEDLAIVQFRGKTGPYLEPAPGAATFDLLRMVRDELRMPLRRLLDSARSSRRTRRTLTSLGEVGLSPRTIELEVIPFAVASNPKCFFIVLFKEPPSGEVESEIDATTTEELHLNDDHQLEQELANTRDYLQATIERLEASNEELRSANEEISSNNEELRSTNEELQMAKEELQSTNEELRTVNEEMSVRNAEVARLNDDLTNVLTSVEIPILMLDRESRVRRLTHAASEVFRIPTHELGRIMLDITSFPDRAIERMIADVRARLGAASHTLQSDTGRWYQITVRPYLTNDSRVDGTVITAFDIDDVKRAEQDFMRAQQYAESIVDTVRESLVVLDRELRIRSVNQTFCRTFGVTSAEVEQKPFHEVSGWDIPELSDRLTQLGEGDSFEDFCATDEAQVGAPRAFLLNARRIAGTSHILLALEDVTEREQARRKSDEYRSKMQHIAFEAVLAEDRERRKIATDLHDRIGQSLALTQMKLDELRKTASEETRTELDRARDWIAESIDDLRNLTFDLSPPVLHDLGIEAAIAWLTDDLGQRHGLRVDIEDDGQPKVLEHAVATLVFRAVRELLINVIKHARTTHATISMRRAGDALEINVHDSGDGFDPTLVTGQQATGFGLFSVNERIQQLGGTLSIQSAPRQGAHIKICIPLAMGSALAGTQT